MSLLLKIITIIRYRGVFIVIRQFIAQLLLLYAPRLLLPKVVLPLRAFLLIGYFPNKNKPTTFNEIICHRREYKEDPRAVLIADKCLVRKYINDRGFGEILNEVYYITSNPDTIKFSALPDSFVIKANYASGMNIIIKNKNNININNVISKCKYWINKKNKILDRNPEVHYRDIEPKIIIEKYLDCSEPNGLLDYKFWCFSGNALFINVQLCLNGTRVAQMYDRDWRLQPFSTANKPIDTVIVKKPIGFDSMIEIAEILSDQFNFLRVDLYNLNNNKIVFGELTYNPSGGTVIFYPKLFDYKLGRLFEKLNDSQKCEY